MKRLFLVGALAALALGVVPAHAAPSVTPCPGTGPELEVDCKFTTTSASVGYILASPNTWSIYVIRENQKVQLKGGSFSSSSPQSGIQQGTVTASVGEEVHLHLGKPAPGDCAGPACGTVGVLIGYTM